MELAKIENLLDLYFEGNTTLEEERVLQNYFTQAFVPAHLQEYKSMFSYFAKNRTEASQAINTQKSKKKTWNTKWLLIASALLLIVTVLKMRPSSNDFSNRERAEAEKALIESQKAFALISKSFKRGHEKLVYLGNYEVTKNKIFK